MMECEYIDCKELGTKKYSKEQPALCDFHEKGGILGNGTTYESYRIVENDFLEYIKFVPLTNEHLNVHSPVLQDIIIRSCIQIEIFFKEWGRYYCSNTKLENKLLDKYNNNKGVRNWNFGDYFIFKDKFNNFNSVVVANLNIEINPFETWQSEKQPPIWWETYNKIKHDGHKSTKNCTLEIAMLSLAALFQLHYANQLSRSHLRSFTNYSISMDGFEMVVIDNGISTPIETKKYLFKINNTANRNKYKIETDYSKQKNYV